MTCTSTLISARGAGGSVVSTAPSRSGREPLGRLRQALHAWWGRRVDAWHERRALARTRAELELAAELGEATLRDIGAPEWLLNEAAARSSIRREQLSTTWLNATNGRH